MNPLVSVVLTSYNQKDKLAKAFQSILSQTYEHIEIIIVDDCSTDKISQDYILSIAKKYPKKVRYYFQSENVGIPKNKNTGLRMAKGKFITYLDGDDFYYPEKIEKELAVFYERPELDVVYSNFSFVSEKEEIQRHWKTDKEPVFEGKILKHVISRNFPKFTLYRFELMKKHVLKKINYLDEKLFVYEDWDSRIRYSKFANIGYCDFIGSAYVSDSSGISYHTKTLILLLEMQKVFLKNIHLLKNEYSPKERKNIRVKFLNNNYINILKNIDRRKNPLLYLKTKLKRKLL